MTRLVFSLGGIGAVAGLAAALAGIALGAGPVAWAAVAVGWAAGAAAAPWAASAAATARAEAVRDAREAVERLAPVTAAAAEAGERLAAAARAAAEAGATTTEAPWEAVAASLEAAGDVQNEACLAACGLSAALGADPAGADAARLAEDLRRSADRFIALRDDVRARVGRSEEAAGRLREAAREAEGRRAALDKTLKELDLRFGEVRSSLGRNGAQGAGESGR